MENEARWKLAGRKKPTNLWSLRGVFPYKPPVIASDANASRGNPLLGGVIHVGLQRRHACPTGTCLGRVGVSSEAFPGWEPRRFRVSPCEDVSVSHQQTRVLRRGRTGAVLPKRPRVAYPLTLRMRMHVQVRGLL